MIKLKKLSPYLLISFLFIGFWKLLTWTENYAMNPQGKELLLLDIALTQIFIYKTAFWLIISNLIVFVLTQLIKKNIKIVTIAGSFTVLFYLIIGQAVGKKCAPHYYSVFINQSTMEELLTRPIKQAGYHIGTILTKNIQAKSMKHRRYAIGGLEQIKYKPATPTLEKIMLDKTEPDYIRADALETLLSFKDAKSTKIVNEFRDKAIDPIDKNVIELVNKWSSIKERK